MQARCRRKQKTAGWAALCAVLFCAAVGWLLAARAASCTEIHFPLDTAEWSISSPYGWRTDPLTGEKAIHSGVDLACAEGTPVLAAMAGSVAAARRSAGYGSCVRLCHAGGQETLYAHLQYVFVRAGELVQAGQPLGTAGQTGRATGAHLHFELLVEGERCDPSALLGLP